MHLLAQYARATVSIASDESHRGGKYAGVKLDASPAVQRCLPPGYMPLACVALWHGEFR